MQAGLDSEEEPLPEHEYPSNPDYGPKSSDPRVRDAWTLLDHIKPGLIPPDVRAFIVGGMVALIAEYAEQKPVDFRHARILQDFARSGATVEDLARAWASLDGKELSFDAEREMSAAVDGDYLGYLSEAEEVLRRATRYAAERRDEKS